MNTILWIIYGIIAAAVLFRMAKMMTLSDWHHWHKSLWKDLGVGFTALFMASLLETYVCPDTKKAMLLLYMPAGLIFLPQLVAFYGFLSREPGKGDCPICQRDHNIKPEEFTDEREELVLMFFVVLTICVIAYLLPAAFFGLTITKRLLWIVFLGMALYTIWMHKIVQKAYHSFRRNQRARKNMAFESVSDNNDLGPMPIKLKPHAKKLAEFLEISGKYLTLPKLNKGWDSFCEKYHRSAHNHDDISLYDTAQTAYNTLKKLFV